MAFSRIEINKAGLVRVTKERGKYRGQVAVGWTKNPIKARQIAKQLNKEIEAGDIEADIFTEATIRMADAQILLVPTDHIKPKEESSDSS